MLNRYLVILSSVLVIPGCASITGTNVQTLRIETQMSDGTPVDGANCELINEYGKFRVITPGYVNVRRAFSDIKINCIKGSLSAANANAIARANMGMYGNVMIGGLVGAAIDHSRGAGYSYPQWMQLVFGRTLSFDRYNDQEALPSLGTEQVRY